MVVMGGGRDAQCVCKVPQVVLPCYQAVGPGCSNREKFELVLALAYLLFFWECATPPQETCTPRVHAHNLRLPLMH